MRSLVFAFLGVSLWACSGKERPPYLDSSGGNGSGSDGSGSIDGGEDCEGPPTVDTSQLCGNEVVPVVQQKPNLYFVVDVSGSMAETITKNGTTKLSAAKSSLVSVARDLGHRINYGLATFPGPDSEDDYPGCGAGLEVFQTREGDPIECLNRPPGGPVLDAFRERVHAMRALGGTPLSASLEKLSPGLLELEGETVVVLMTDGAPNCNLDILCDADECMLNIEGAYTNGQACNDELNCCDPDLGAQTLLIAPMSWCVDVDESTQQIADLLDAGIRTYVVGVPGSEVYADVMNRMAQAGGTGRSGNVAYYDVTDLEELTNTLRSIGSTIAQSCEISIAEPPLFPEMVNVYLDAELLPSDPEDGWTLDEAEVTLHGAACEKVRSGDVIQVQIVTGCKTVVR